MRDSLRDGLRRVIGSHRQPGRLKAARRARSRAQHHFEERFREALLAWLPSETPAHRDTLLRVEPLLEEGEERGCAPLNELAGGQLMTGKNGVDIYATQL